jgi:MFS family permease
LTTPFSSSGDTNPSGLQAGEGPPSLQARKSALLVISLIAGLIAYDFASTNVSVATLRGALGFSTSALPWIISAYTLTFGGFLLLAGRLGDLFGRRRVLLVGLAIYVIFSILGALSTSVWLFLLTRVVKGIGASLLAPNSLALLNSLYQEGKERHGALSTYAVVASAGYAIGNFLGGVLTSYSWRATVFVSAISSLIIFFLARRQLCPDRRPVSSGEFDYLGAILSTLAFGSLIFSVSESLALGLTSTVTLSFLGAAALFFTLFFIHINRHPDPLLPPRFLRFRNVIGAGGVIFFLIGSGQGTFFQIALFMQDVLHYSAKQTGIALIPFVLVGLLGSFYVHKPLNRFGYHKTLVVSLIFVLLFVLSFLNLNETSTYWLGLIPGLALWDGAFPLAYISTRVPAGVGLAPEEQGIANGINFAFEQIGSAFGISVLAAVNAAARSAHGGDAVAASVAGFHWAFAVSGFLMFLAVLIAAFVVRPSRTPAGEEIPVTIPTGVAE